MDRSLTHIGSGFLLALVVEKGYIGQKLWKAKAGFLVLALSFWSFPVGAESKFLLPKSQMLLKR